MQISVGLGVQLFILRMGLWCVGFSHLDAIIKMDISFFPAYLLLLVLGVYLLSSLVGGAIAGAWCVNWHVQGIAVGLGFTGIVLIRIMFFRAGMTGEVRRRSPVGFATR